MKLKRWEIRFAALLLGLSAALYVARALLFPGAGMLNEMLRYLLDDIAFVPISVLLVTLVIQRMMDIREQDALANKMNMVIGAFFSEVGRPLIDLVRPFDADDSCVSAALIFGTGWKVADFNAARRTLESYDYGVDARASDLGTLRTFLDSKRGFMLGLLQNANLLENESFTELLWAVLHLQEELDARGELGSLTEADARHVSVDIKRAYHALLVEWLGYMRHLSERYPHLYSFAVRTNPYDPAGRAELG